jgi:hypothetical protein
MHYSLGFNLLNPQYKITYWKFWTHIFNPRTYWRWISNFCHRGFYGYSKEDYWNGESYLESVMYGIIKDLRENHIGYPSNLSEESWNSILDEIIEGLEAADELRMENTVPKGIYSEGPWKFVPCENNPEFYTMIDESNHVFDKEGYDKWQAPLLQKRKRAMLLICKHWLSFWD